MALKPVWMALKPADLVTVSAHTVRRILTA